MSVFVENLSGFADTDLLGIAKRDGNTNRLFLLVNRFLGKHIPVVPSLALSYFERLGHRVCRDCTDENVLVIGFAETATAVGAGVAAAVAETAAKAVFCHTTRENIDLMYRVVKFSEEHSHATNQELYLKDYDIACFDRIVFVEDEITTGRTILNFLSALKDYVKNDVKYTVAALVFGNFNELVFAEYSVTFHCLTRIDTSAIVVNDVSEQVTACPKQSETHIKIRERHLFPNPRTGVPAGEYISGCRAFSQMLAEQINFADKNVLVLGSEEFMFPALTAGREIERTAKCVHFHATTRSPVVPCGNPGYPLVSRIMLSSLYNENRITYLYNLREYDTAVIITDSDKETAGYRQAVAALRSAGIDEIHIERWIL